MITTMKKVGNCFQFLMGIWDYKEKSTSRVDVLLFLIMLNRPVLSLPFASVSKQVLVQNHSNENDLYDLYEMDVLVRHTLK